MGLWSAMKETWEEVSYEADNQFRKLGCVLRIKVSTGYRYGIYCGPEKIAVARGGKVQVESYSKFREGESFINAGYVQAMLFTVSRTTKESLKLAMRLIGQDIDMNNREFAMFCRTGNKLFKGEDVSGSFSLRALKVWRSEDCYQIASQERDKARRDAIVSALQIFRAPLLRALAVELRSSLPENLFTLKLRSGTQLFVHSNVDKQFQSLSKALGILKPREAYGQTGLSVCTSLDCDVEEIVRKTLSTAYVKYGSACGIYEGVCYLPETDTFLADLEKKLPSIKA